MSVPYGSGETSEVQPPHKKKGEFLVIFLPLNDLRTPKGLALSVRD